MRWAKHVACTEERRGSYTILVGKSEGRGPLERPTRRWEDNIKCIFGKWDRIMDWIDLAQDRDRWQAVVNAVMNLRVL